MSREADSTEDLASVARWRGSGEQARDRFARALLTASGALGADKRSSLGAAAVR